MTMTAAKERGVAKVQGVAADGICIVSSFGQAGFSCSRAHIGT